MNKVLVVTNYKGFIGNKYNATPYRSGYSKRKLLDYFHEFGMSLDFKNPSTINFNKKLDYDYVIYDSMEDYRGYYKTYIEDVLLGLDLKGLKLVPDFKFLRAHENKVFMEILRKISSLDIGIESSVFGSLEEFKKYCNFEYPLVIKTSGGSMSEGVYLAKDYNEAVTCIKKSCSTFHLGKALKDLGRKYKHDGYVRNSLYRRKFIVQQFIPSLKYDWKVVVFGKKYFVIKRPVRNNDFRASGSGQSNYKFGTASQVPNTILKFAKKIYEELNVPFASLDIVETETDCKLIEFQILNFGTSAVMKSDVYFTHENGKWLTKENLEEIEKYYAESVCEYILL